MRRSAPSRPSTSCTCTSCPSSTRSCSRGRPAPGRGNAARTGSQAGEFTLSQALFDSFRFNLSRQIVGEVRGHEILAMLKAMESGAGSISTTHAAIRRGRDRQARHLRDGGRTARHPRLRRPRHRRRDRHRRPRPPRDHPDAPTGPRSGTGGSPRSSPSPPGSGRRGTPSSTCSAPPPARPKPPRTSWTTTTGTWPGTGFDLDGFYATAPGGPRHDRPASRPWPAP